MNDKKALPYYTIPIEIKNYFLKIESVKYDN